MVDFVPGRSLGTLHPKTPVILRAVGAAAAQIGERLASFPVAGVPDPFPWDVRHGAVRVEAGQEAIADPDRRSLLGAVVRRAAEALEPLWAELPVGVVHGDLNDHNVIVDVGIGVIDFGDLHVSVRAAEVAVAAAYAALGFPDPVGAIAEMVAGSHAVRPRSDAELAALVPLVVMRLGISVVTAARQTVADPANPYLAISQAEAWATLERLAATPWYLALARIRAACGLAPCLRRPLVEAWLGDHPELVHPVLAVPMTAANSCSIDWSVGSPLVAHPAIAPPVEQQTRQTSRIMEDAGATVGIGRFGEPRLVYAGPEYAVATNSGPGWRTVHLGVDLSCPPGTPVQAMYDGVVERVDDDAVDGGYGPVVTLRHAPPGCPPFFTLSGHLSRASVAGMAPGREVHGGEVIGAVGEPHENGGWPPHLHFQAMTDLLDLDDPFPGVAEPGEWDAWAGLIVSPAAALRLPAELVEAPRPADEAVVTRRAELLPPSLSTTYAHALVAVRGHGAWLYDGWGRAHLDCVNNVAHVGHEHPHVVAALTRHAALLNTNSRYPHPERVRYLERLAGLFPDPLDTVFLVCTGSEANDLALRIARTVTGTRDLVVLEGGYHGHTTELIAASHYKHAGPGGTGTPPYVHVAPLPDPYRSPARSDAAAHVRGVVEALAAAPEGVAAFLAEPIPGVAGQIVPPAGWLALSAAAARRAGALVICDEVQVGLGRVGTHWWAFERDGVVPDIVTLGKPLGNGHPMAAVVTTRAIAESFANGMEYFNTFGGNPVSCAVGNAVVDVLEREGLRERAATTGAALLAELRGLAADHPIIGDVRGAGLFIGVELVRDRTTKEPAAAPAAYVAERAREMGVLLSVDGLLHNVLKIKPPLVFGPAEVDRLVTTLDVVLAEDGAQADA
jgi:4-aminobutyrate aminotransferase-like enzyme